MSFQQGLSGLNSAAKGLDVVSNNIANANTVGFKSAETHFADVFANSLSGGGAAQAGIGVTTAAVVQQFSQGNITSTNNPLDISINGGGFYRMSSGGNVTYSRNGQFHLDKDGYVVDDRARRLTGYLAQNGLIVRSTPADLQLSSANIDPVATGQSSGSGRKGVLASLNLDSRLTVPTAPFVPSGGTINPLSYNFSTSTSVFDTLGNPHTLTMYAVKATPTSITAAVTAATTAVADAAAATTAAAALPRTTAAEIAASDAAIAAAAAQTTAANSQQAAALAAQTAFGTPAAGVSTWLMYTTLDNTDSSYINGGVPINLAFNDSGKLISQNGSPTNPPMLTVDLTGVMGALVPPQTNIAASPLAFNIDFTGSTQFGAANGVNSLQQDGYTSGRLTGVSVSADGTIRGNYSNGQSKDLAQVALANFTNPNGLASLGGNQWAETSTSGPALVGAPNTGTLGVLQSAAVEESNVDLTAELVKMITQQRNYQANAQSIKTQDQIMQTLVNLR